MEGESPSGTPILRRAARCQLAAHPGSRPERLALLAQDESWRVRMAVASNPAVPLSLLQQLAQDPHPRPRLQAARRVELDADALARLAADEFVPIRQTVASHHATSSSCLAQLATDTDPIVRLHVAAHPSTDLQTLTTLSLDPHPPTVVATAAHLNTPPPVLMTLTEPDPEIALVAARNPSLPHSHLDALARAHRRDRAWCRALAANPAISPTTLGRLVRRAPWDVQCIAAANLSLSDTTAMTLAASPWRSVRAAVARHCTCTQALAKALNGREPMVHLALAANPACPPEVLDRIVGSDEHAFRKGRGRITGKALSNPNLPTHTLLTLAGRDGLPP